jgi:hypothetical protein
MRRNPGSHTWQTILVQPVRHDATHRRTNEGVITLDDPFRSEADVIAELTQDVVTGLASGVALNRLATLLELIAEKATILEDAFNEASDTPWPSDSLDEDDPFTQAVADWPDYPPEWL